MWPLSGSSPRASRSTTTSKTYPRSLVGVADAGQGVVVGHEVEGVVAALEVDILADRPQVVADVQGARGLDSGQDAHGLRNRSQCSRKTIEIPSGSLVVRLDAQRLDLLYQAFGSMPLPVLAGFGLSGPGPLCFGPSPLLFGPGPLLLGPGRARSSAGRSFSSARWPAPHRRVGPLLIGPGPLLGGPAVVRPRPGGRPRRAWRLFSSARRSFVLGAVALVAPARWRSSARPGVRSSSARWCSAASALAMRV